MTGVFTKPLLKIGPADIAELVTRGWPESDDCEFKENIPERDGNNDVWIASDGQRIGQYGRNELLSEVIAFANAYGGTLVLGIEETTDQPKRAKAIKPILKCADLAARLEDAARECIEPRLPILQARGVPTEASGSGVVIVRVEASRSAPHRLNTTKDCYYRRGSSTTKMTMREIHELTLERERSGVRNAGRIQRAHTEFIQWLGQHEPPLPKGILGIRATAVPVNPVRDCPRLYGRDDAIWPIGNFIAWAGRLKIEANFSVYGHNTRPLLRGVRRYNDEPRGMRYEHYEDGTVTLLKRIPENQHFEGIAAQWVLAVLLNSLEAIERFRQFLGLPEAEFELSVSIVRKSSVVGPQHGLGGPIGFWPFTEGQGFPCPEYLEPNPLVLPQYSVGPRGEFDALVNVIIGDVSDAAGARRMSDVIKVEW